MRISVTAELSMGHRLLGYHGLCANLHGHNYEITVSVDGNADEMGLVVDYKELKRVLRGVLEPFDHAMVLVKTDPEREMLLSNNKIVLLSVNPSAENLASLWFNLMFDAGYAPSEVRVRETRDSLAIATSVDRKAVRVR